MVFKQIFRVAFIALVWKQYKQIIVSSLGLFGFLYLVGSLHADFLQHAELNADSSNVGLSFVYKWTALAGGIILYFAYHYFRPRQKDPAKEKQQRIEKELAELHDEDDPFASIRARKKLRSRADFLMDKNKK
jgi:hypothetical protein